jgi:hypothetical protein
LINHKGLVAAMLVMLGLMLSACSALQSQAACNGNFKDMMPSDWKFISQTPLDTDGQPPLECVVLYRFDAKKDGQKITPVGGVIYRQDHGRPRWIYPHRLLPPEGFYLGERSVTARVADALSGQTGPELIVEDRDPDGNITQATIFRWQDSVSGKPDTDPTSELKTMGYNVLGLFQGDGGVTVSGDRVQVVVRRKGTRSQLADQQVFVPRDKKSYLQEDGVKLIAPAEVEIISLTMGDDPTVSPYPEKTVLAFYQSVKDDAKLEGLMTPDALGLLKAGKLAYGCTSDRAQLDRVLVQDLDWNLGNLDNPQVLVKKGQCKLKDASFKDMTQATWFFSKVENKWRLAGVK